MTRVRDVTKPVKERKDYFYTYVYLYYDELQKNKEDLYYASDLLVEADESLV